MIWESGDEANESVCACSAFSNSLTSAIFQSKVGFVQPTIWAIFTTDGPVSKHTMYILYLKGAWTYCIINEVAPGDCQRMK